MEKQKTQLLQSCQGDGDDDENEEDLVFQNQEQHFQRQDTDGNDDDDDDDDEDELLDDLEEEPMVETQQLKPVEQQKQE